MRWRPPSRAASSVIGARLDLARRQISLDLVSHFLVVVGDYLHLHPQCRVRDGFGQPPCLGRPLPILIRRIHVFKTATATLRFSIGCLTACLAGAGSA